MDSRAAPLYTTPSLVSLPGQVDRKPKERTEGPPVNSGRRNKFYIRVFASYYFFKRENARAGARNSRYLRRGRVLVTKRSASTSLAIVARRDVVGGLVFHPPRRRRPSFHRPLRATSRHAATAARRPPFLFLILRSVSRRPPPPPSPGASPAVRLSLVSALPSSRCIPRCRFHQLSLRQEYKDLRRSSLGCSGRGQWRNYEFRSYRRDFPLYDATFCRAP